MQRLQHWFARLGFYWDRRVLMRQGLWGDTPETLEYMLEWLTPKRLSRISLADKKRTRLRTRSVDVDELTQALVRAHWIVRDRETVPRELLLDNPEVERSLDDYLLTVYKTPIRPEEVVARVSTELHPLLEMLRVMYSENDAWLGYYQRQYHWLFVELRAVLQALISACVPGLRF